MGISIHSGIPVTPAPPAANPEGKQRLPRKFNRKLVRKRTRDYSQQLRHGFQAAFLLLNVWLGCQFYLWVRQFEVPGSSTSIGLPAGVEGWLPIAGLMNVKYWLATGIIPAMHPAAMFLLLAFLSMAFLFRKAFCSWLCPVGTISEYLWRAGYKMLPRNFHIPRWLDIPMRGLKYLLLGLFVWAVASMSAEAIESFMRTPYGLIAEVKMLNFFRYLGTTGLVVIGVLALASLFVENFWCRYLCPYGAMLGLVSLASPHRIRRNPEVCIDCAKCARACPSMLPVDRVARVLSAECTGCLACVSVCPSEGALAMSLPRMLESKSKRHDMPAWAMAAGIALLFLGIVGFAKATGHWSSPVSDSVYQQLVPRASSVQHPMP
ncbi:MAG: 4Fe-4S binding protein [Acidobacteria bacterium]|nr:MAG: 4Fe-4S binding protein [Acidobacteriota bacterium]